MSLLSRFNDVANSTSSGTTNEPPPPVNVYTQARNSHAAPHIIPYKSLNDPDLPYYDFDCHPYRRQDETEIYIYGERPEGELTPEMMPKQWYRSMQEVLGHPGEYTWMLFDTPENEPLFIAAKYLTPAELMSKHKNIQREYAEHKIIAAGECRIDETRNVRYNFISGTYMVPIMSKFKYAFGANTNYRNTYRPYVSGLWTAAGAASVTYTDEVLLQPFMTHNTRFGNYTKLGYKFPEFSTKEECNAYKAKVVAKRGGSRGSKRKTMKKKRNRNNRTTKFRN